MTGDSYHNTVVALGNLASLHLRMKNYAAALPLCIKGYSTADQCKSLSHDDGKYKFASFLSEIYWKYTGNLAAARNWVGACIILWLNVCGSAAAGLHNNRVI